MTTRRDLQRALLTTITTLALAFPAAAVAIPPGEAAALLSQQRQANGLPPLTESGALDDGCAKHNHYIALNGGTLTHTEDSSRPGYTPEGARAGANSASEVLHFTNKAWDGAWKNPWNGAPIHELLMFSPSVGTTGYADSEGFICMRFQRSETSPSGTFSHPGNGATGVPTEIVQRESPYTPAEALGLPARTGQNIHVWRGDDPSLVSNATLTGPSGAVDVRWLDTRSPTPDGGTYDWGAATFVPVSPLQPFAGYALDVTFTDGVTYRTAFTTGAAPASATQPPTVIPSPPKQGGGSSGSSGGGGSKGRDRSTTRRVQKVRLSLRGRVLKVISGPAYVTPRTAKVRFRNARNRTIVARSVRLSGTKRLRIPRGTRRIELRASQTASHRPVVLLARVKNGR